MLASLVLPPAWLSRLTPAEWRSLFVRTALAVLAIASTASLWHSALPSFGATTYQYGSGETLDAEIPLSVASAGRKLTIHSTVRVGSVHPLLFRVVPDDCLESIAVNGVPIEFERPMCFEHEGGTLWLGGRLHSGLNAIEMRIDDQGGMGGVRMGVSLRDPVLLLALTLGVAVLGLYLAYVARLLGHTTVVTCCVVIVGLVVAARLPYGFAIGCVSDQQLFREWARSAAELGAARSYVQQVGDVVPPNYPPFTVLLLGAAGRAYHSLVSTNFDTGLPECRFFMKLPAIVADGATAIVLFFVVKKLKSGSVAWGLTAGLAYAVHPAVIYDSMAWGQIDSVFSCFALVTVVALVSGRWALVGAFGALALLTKLQAVVVMPMAAVLCLLERRRLVRATFSAAATTVAVFASFLSGPALQAIKGVYLGSAGFYSVLSMQGYNAWVALFGLGEADRSDLDLFFGAVRYRTVGVALFAVCATAFALVGLRRLRLATTHESRARILFLVSALTAYAFFLVNTEVHERYLFALMPLALPLAFLGRTEGWLYLASSSLFFLNLLGPLPWTNLDRALFRELPNLPAFIGACHILVFGRLATRLWRNVPHAPESH